MITFEHLLIVDRKTTRSHDIQSLKHQINANSNIRLQGNTVRFSDFELRLSILKEKSENSDEIYFFLKYQCEKDEEVEKFAKAIREIRSSLSLVSKDFIVLWDDISIFYAQQIYPDLNRLENLMRKLIARLMISGHGASWLKDRIPKDIESSNKRGSRGDNLLYKLDFIELSNLLFSENYPSHKENLIKKIRDTERPEEVDLDEIKSLLPISNWDKYFDDNIDCDGSYLQSRWKKIYEYRNKIAHNITFVKDDYESLSNLISEVKPYLEQALSNLDVLSNRIDMEGLEGEIYLDNTHQKFEELREKFEELEILAADLLYMKYEASRTERNLSDNTIYAYLRDKHKIINHEDFERVWKLRSLIRSVGHAKGRRISIKELREGLDFVKALTEKLNEKLL